MPIAPSRRKTCGCKEKRWPRPPPTPTRPSIRAAERYDMKQPRHTAAVRDFGSGFDARMIRAYKGERFLGLGNEFKHVRSSKRPTGRTRCRSAGQQVPLRSAHWIRSASPLLALARVLPPWRLQTSAVRCPFVRPTLAVPSHLEDNTEPVRALSRCLGQKAC